MIAIELRPFEAPIASALTTEYSSAVSLICGSSTRKWGEMSAGVFGTQEVET
jgi:hypothetical protein